MIRLPSRACWWILGLLAGALPLSAAKLSTDPYLQSSTPNSVVVVWRTLGPIKPTVRYGKDSKNLDQVVPEASVQVAVSADGSDEAIKLFNAKEDNAPSGTHQYMATIQGLEPKTKYYYSVGDGDSVLASGDTYFFKTHPPVGEKTPMRIWVVGDSGRNNRDQIMVNDAALAYMKQSRPLDFYIHVGDMAYSDGYDKDFQKKFFKIYEATLRNTVCWPSMGNHEGHTSNGLTGTGPYYDVYVLPTKGEAGGVASGSEAYYSFDYGRAHFICLNSHDLDRKPSGAMAQWLKADLEKATADWLIAFWHHPPYTKGSHDSDKEKPLAEMRTEIMPLLEAHGVDIVFTGHSHTYERSMLIDGAYATPTVADNVILNDGDGNPSGDGAYLKSAGLNPNEGAVQVVTGHGGTQLKRVGNSPVMKQVLMEFGSMIVDVDDDTMKGIMVNKWGAERDVFSIVKKGKVTPKRVANPRLLPPYRMIVSERAPCMYSTTATPPEDWMSPSFDDSSWTKGIPGLGYGDNDDETQLTDMSGKYRTVYMRQQFELKEAGRFGDIHLLMNYDDAFIVYLDGKEILRVGVGEGSGANAKNIQPHKAKGYEVFSLKEHLPLFTAGKHVLAIEGHNDDLASTGFTLDPALAGLPNK
jgi:acid phosphatase type 7